MKLKQLAGIVFISAATTLGSLWGYNHLNQITQTGTYFYKQDSAKVPANYAKFFNNEKSAGPADFVDAASAAIPARSGRWNTRFPLRRPRVRRHNGSRFAPASPGT